MFCFIRQILSFYQTDLLPSESAAELFDVAGWCYVAHNEFNRFCSEIRKKGEFKRKEAEIGSV